MSNKFNSGGSILLWIVAIALLMFTGARSVHLVTSTLPPDMAILGFAALAGLDIGLLAWLFWLTRSARGGAQRTIGTLMIVLDLAGIAVAVIGDTMLVVNAEAYTDLVQTAAVWAVPAIILSNIVGIVVAHIVDPEQAIRDSERALEDALRWQLAETMRANAGQVAAGVVPDAAKHKQAEMVAGFLAGVTGKPGQNGQSDKPGLVALNADGGDVPASGKRSKAAPK